MPNCRIVGMTAGLLACALSGVAAGGDKVERFPDGSVSVQAVDAPLGSLLRQVARRALVDREVESRSVSVAVERQPVTEALHAIVSAAGVGYIVYGDAVYAGTQAMARAARERAEERAGPAEDMDSPAGAAAWRTRLRREPPKAAPPRPAAADGGPDAEEDPGAEAAARETAVHTQKQFEELLAKMAPIPGGPAERAVTVPVPQPDGESMIDTSVTRGAGGVIVLPFVGPDGEPRSVRVDPSTPPLNPLEALPPEPPSPPPPKAPRSDPDSGGQH